MRRPIYRRTHHRWILRRDLLPPVSFIWYFTAHSTETPPTHPQNQEQAGVLESIAHDFGSGPLNVLHGTYTSGYSGPVGSEPVPQWPLPLSSALRIEAVGYGGGLLGFFEPPYGNAGWSVFVARDMTTNEWVVFGDFIEMGRFDCTVDLDEVWHIGLSIDVENEELNVEGSIDFIDPGPTSAVVPPVEPRVYFGAFGSSLEEGWLFSIAVGEPYSTYPLLEETSILPPP